MALLALGSCPHWGHYGVGRRVSPHKKKSMALLANEKNERDEQTSREQPSVVALPLLLRERVISSG